jgi:Domain of unknown function (DUF5655)
VERGRWPVASADGDFAPYLAGRPDAAQALFWRFVTMTRACGPVTFELQHSPVVLRGNRRIFGAVTVTDRGLRGYLNLPRNLTDRRIRAVHPLTSRLVMNRFVLTSMAELDDTFGAWLAEAREVGNGARTSAG